MRIIKPVSIDLVYCKFMSLLKFGKVRILVVGVVLLLGLVLAGGQAPVGAVGEDRVDWFEGDVACWSTGLPGSEFSAVRAVTGTGNDGWGSRDEFTVDFRDLGSNLPELNKLGYLADSTLGEAYLEGVGLRVGGALSDAVVYSASRGVTGVVNGIFHSGGSPLTGFFGGTGYFSGVAAAGLEAAGTGFVQFSKGAVVPAITDFGGAVVATGEGGVRAAKNIFGRMRGFVTGYEYTPEVQIPVTSPLSRADLQAYKFRTPALFDSFAEAIDYTFAADVLPDDNWFGGDRYYLDRGIDVVDSQVDDLRLIYLDWLLDNRASSTRQPELGVTLPWKDQFSYLQRRAVAKATPSRVLKFSANWVNPNNPDGGIQFSHIDATIERRAAELDVLAASRQTEVSGNHILTGVQQAAALELFNSDVMTCVFGSCTETSTLNSVPIMVNGTVNMTDTNNGQSVVTDFQPSTRSVGIFEGDGYPRTTDVVNINPEFFDVSTVDYRKEQGGSFGDLFILDTDSDEIVVNLELNDEFRKDYEFDGGRYFEESLLLPAMGFDESTWTYDQFADGRAFAVNDPVEVVGTAVTGVLHGPQLPRDYSYKHVGYRQPSLSRAYFCHLLDSPSRCLPKRTDMFDAPDPAPIPTYIPVDLGLSLTTAGIRHIRWPTNTQDLQWYLYQLPGGGVGDSPWLFWISQEGQRRLVHSGYGVQAVVDLPTCIVEGSEVLLPGGKASQVPLLDSKNVVCDLIGDHVQANWDATAISDGAGPRVYYPFDISVADPGELLLGEGTSHPNTHDPVDFALVKSGVESPVDIKDEIGSRNMNRFSFSIREENQLSSEDLDAEGSDALKRHGVPLDGEARIKYLEEWRAWEIDPNRPYLMVITYYESLEPKLNTRRFEILGDGKEEFGEFTLPQRYIRRVVCRMMVLPPGFSSEAVAHSGLFSRTAENMKAALTEEFQQLWGWLESILRGLGTAHLVLAQRGGEVACLGMIKLDQLTALDNVSASAVQARVSEGGVLEINSASRSRNRGIDQCRRVSAPAQPVCDSNFDVITSGRCISLPKMKIEVRGAEFLDLDGIADGVEFREYWRGNRLETVLSGIFEDEVYIGGTAEDFDADPQRFYPALNFGFEEQLNPRNVGLTRVSLDWDFESPAVSNDVYQAIEGFVLYVYPDEKSSPLPPGEPLKIILPKWIEETVTPTYGSAYASGHHSVDGFEVGGLNVYGLESMGSNGLARAYHGGVAGTSSFSVDGSQLIKDEYKRFIRYVDNLPLAPGFVHKFVVAPFVGKPGVVGSFREGPPSEPMILDGNRAACLVPTDKTTSPQESYLKYHVYKCDTSGDAGYAEEGPTIGLLSLTGTDICKDIFSSTPAGFTWDNPVVKQVWGFMWIIAGGVLFSLLVWQGLRMTYDIWLDPQPIVGFRELVPRFLLAITLAAGSLLLCQLVLIIASDVTCFVAQVTGMSMWGVIGTTFGSIMDGYLDWSQGIIEFTLEATLLAILKTVFQLLFGGLLVIILLLGLLYMFIKVALGMVLRIALLAVLIALSPLAFAFYASDSTSHWTKRWVSMFLGASFQQVVVLIVIYLGGHMLGNYLGGASESTFSVLIIGLLLGFAALALAAKVPDIVNPAGQGLFSSFGEMSKMAMAGGLVAASVGAMAVAGPFVAGAGAAAGGIRSAMGGQSPAGGGSPPGGPSNSGVTMSLGGTTQTPGFVAPLAHQNFAAPGTVHGTGRTGSGPTVPGTVQQSPGGPGSPGGGQQPPQGPISPGGPVGGSPVPVPGAPVVPLSGSGAAATPSGSQPGGVQPIVGPVSGEGEASGEGSGESEAKKGGLSLGSVMRGAAAGGMFVPLQMLQGARRGARWSTGMNTRVADVVSGNSLYRHSSRADDAAVQQEKARSERQTEAGKTRTSYNRMSDVLERLERRL